MSSKSLVFQVESQTQIGPPPNYLENDFETTLPLAAANFNNHMLSTIITEGQSQLRTSRFRQNSNTLCHICTVSICNTDYTIEIVWQRTCTTKEFLKNCYRNLWFTSLRFFWHICMLIFFHLATRFAHCYALRKNIYKRICYFYRRVRIPWHFGHCGFKKGPLGLLSCTSAQSCCKLFSPEGDCSKLLLHALTDINLS